MYHQVSLSGVGPLPAQSSMHRNFFFSSAAAQFMQSAVQVNVLDTEALTKVLTDEKCDLATWIVVIHLRIETAHMLAHYDQWLPRTVNLLGICCRARAQQRFRSIRTGASHCSTVLPLSIPAALYAWTSIEQHRRRSHAHVRG
jgi:hypothetical protein